MITLLLYPLYVKDELRLDEPAACRYNVIASRLLAAQIVFH